MKIFLNLFVAINVVVVVSSENNYSRFVEIPGDDGVMYKLDLEEPAQTNTRISTNIQFLLYTRLNPTSYQVLKANNANSITTSNFNAGNPTVVIVHGWHGSQKSGLNPSIRDAYLKKDDVNVIVVDWNGLASSPYSTAVAGVPAVGRRLGQFLAYINRVIGAPYTSMHLVGFSLGAHVVGSAGRELDGKVARVTGLDPAGPLWENNANRIRSSDGVYVEGIHTDGNTIYGLGIRFAIGDADFFPNGGKHQPGCILSACDHNRSWELFSATVTYNHLEGRQCSNMNQVSSDNCSGSTLKMGNDDLNKTGSGLFRLNTKSKYPY